MRVRRPNGQRQAGNAVHPRRPTGPDHHMLLALIFALQQPAQQPVAPPSHPHRPASARPASPIARVQVEPGDVAVQAGDTVRLRAVAYDSGGQAIPGATTKWFQASHGFEGRVSDDGLVTAGSTGAMQIAAVTSVAGSKPTTTFTRITILPPPAARIAVEPTVKHLYVGQSLSLAAVPYAANNDRRYDPIAWESDAPGVVSVTPAGRITAVRAGRATVTARAGRASQAIPLVVEANPDRRPGTHARRHRGAHRRCRAAPRQRAHRRRASQCPT